MVYIQNLQECGKLNEINSPKSKKKKTSQVPYWVDKIV